jgi:peptide/nickel transport system ATP-binding protein
MSASVARRDEKAHVADEPILKVTDLSILLFTEKADVRAVSNVNYAVFPGKTLAVVGESGSGKTVMNLAPLGLMPAGVSPDVQGSVTLSGTELVGAPGDVLMAVRGREIGVVFQDPLSALNPNRRIGGQIEEILTLRLGMNPNVARKRAAELLTLVGIPEPERRLRLFPHEMSGGMRQRVMIAIALAGEPKVLIADEPTTALDVTIQAQILQLLKTLQESLGMAMVIVTHDIGVVANVADQVAVMYAGSIVEFGDAKQVLVKPRHPYTQALLASVPAPDAAVGSRFNGLNGAPPDLSKSLVGCAFAHRCQLAEAKCAAVAPILTQVSAGAIQRAACLVTNPVATDLEHFKNVAS